MKRKFALGIGIVALVGIALWMRALASWRPQIVARLDLTPIEMRLSKDGRFLAVTGFIKPIAKTRAYRVKSAVLDLQNFTVRSDARALDEFDTQYAAQNFPRVTLNAQNRLEFCPAPGQKVLLADKNAAGGFNFALSRNVASHLAWSKARREVYRESKGVIFIWDWNTGNLKKRLRYLKPGSLHTIAFSPDGLSLLAFDQSQQGVNSLRLYDVPTGQETRVIHRGGRRVTGTRAEAFGWSPDGKAIWFVRQDQMVQFLDFNVVRAADFKPMWSAPCAGISKWLPDGHIGIVQHDGFSFRDALGRETGHTFGPLGNAMDWEAAPDGNFIYSAEKPGLLIRRWRAK